MAAETTLTVLAVLAVSATAIIFIPEPVATVEKITLIEDCTMYRVKPPGVKEVFTTLCPRQHSIMTGWDRRCGLQCRNHVLSVVRVMEQ